MNHRVFLQQMIGLTLVTVLLVGCGTAQVTPTPDRVDTSVTEAKAFTATLTAEAPTATLVPPTATRTATPVPPTATPTPTNTPSPTPTFTPTTPAPTEILYHGVSKCEGMQVKVSFLYHTATSTITSFKAAHGCIKGEGGAEWNPKVSIEVQEDGSFHHTDEYGNFVKGTISSSGEASGELSKGLFKMGCDDGKFYSLCTKWTASPTN